MSVLVTVKPFSNISRKCKKNPFCNRGNIQLRDLWIFRVPSCWEQSNSPFSYLSPVCIAARLVTREVWAPEGASPQRLHSTVLCKPLGRLLLQMSFADCGSEISQCISSLLGRSCDLQGEGGDLPLPLWSIFPSDRQDQPHQSPTTETSAATQALLRWLLSQNLG